MSRPTTQREHISISGNKLSSTLVHFCHEAQKSHSSYVDQVVIHRRTTGKDKPSAVKTNIVPVFVTQEEELEFQKLVKRTNAELEAIIDSTLLNIEDTNCKQGWVELWQDAIKGKQKKEVYLEFLQELNDYVAAWNTDASCDTDEQPDDE